MSNVEGGLEVVNCKSAKEFLDFIDPIDKRWHWTAASADHAYFLGENLRSPWVFRGHTNLEWKLKPAFYRFDTLAMKRIAKSLASYPHSDISLDSKAWDKKYAELIRAYSYRADRIGFGPPLDLQSASAVRQDYPEVLNWEAIAQHSGFPTRLLDWSFNSYIAAFFAVWPLRDVSDFCVWALNTSLLPLQSADTFDYPDNPLDLDVRVVYAPLSASTRLQAQLGLFTVTMPRVGFLPTHPKYENWSDWPHILEIASEPDIEHKYRQFSSPLLRKIVAPQSVAEEVSRMLRLRGYSYSQLMADLEGVAQELLGLMPRE